MEALSNNNNNTNFMTKSQVLGKQFQLKMSINRYIVDRHVKRKTCVLIEVFIFLTHLINWWCWTWQHIRFHYFFGKRFLLIELGLFLHMCFCWDRYYIYIFVNVKKVNKILKYVWIFKYRDFNCRDFGILWCRDFGCHPKNVNVR